MNRAEMNIREVSKFRALNRMAEVVVRRDLDLLKKIDQTIDALSEDRELMMVLTDTIERDLGHIKDIPSVIDQDDKLLPMLERARDSLGEFHTLLTRKCEAARQAPELDADDGVVEAYCSVIDAAARAHNAFNSLCWAIGEHDVDFEEPSGKIYTSVEEMFADLKS